MDRSAACVKNSLFASEPRSNRTGAPPVFPENRGLTTKPTSGPVDAKGASMDLCSGSNWRESAAATATNSSALQIAEISRSVHPLKGNFYE
jgi:hypothetical protein